MALIIIAIVMYASIKLLRDVRFASACSVWILT